jgi:hypothetical protein
MIKTLTIERNRLLSCTSREHRRITTQVERDYRDA